MWQGTIALPNKCGQRYGSFGLTEDGKSVSYRAHRFAWMLCNGKIPDGKLIMHTCDVPLCVNPTHLMLGTHLDNARDREQKGRGTHGALNGRAKLTESQVHFIKRSSKPTQALANRFGVHYTTVMKIKQGVNWAHVE